MPKLLDSAAGHFDVDGLPYQKGSVRVVRKGDDFGLTLTGTETPIVAPQPFGDWTDAVDAPYASANLLLAAFGTTCFQI